MRYETPQGLNRRGARSAKRESFLSALGVLVVQPVATLAVLVAGNVACADVLLRAGQSRVVVSGDTAAAGVQVVNTEAKARQVTVRFVTSRSRCEPDVAALNLPALGWQTVFLRVSLPSGVWQDVLKATVDGATSDLGVQVLRGVDLTLLPWRRRFAPRAGQLDEGLAAPELDDSGWPSFHAPALWQENDWAWCRVHVTVPETWRGVPLRVWMAAVDDNDVTYFNGKRIGATNGWDVVRDYPIAADLLRLGTDNILTVLVDNPTYGGGLYRAPLLITRAGAELASPPTKATVSLKRPAPQPPAPPKPLRPMKLVEGVLRYADGGEVALWGVNYYPQSWYQFDNMVKLKVDFHATINEDLDHLQQMGVEVIRIHVFDREISDGAGNLVDNEHLALLDYLVDQCSRRGIYMFFTPIAWWPGPNQRPDSFSATHSKPSMIFDPEATKAAANYLCNFLTHVNRYSKRAYRDEPSLVLLEVMNEPAYMGYSDLSGAGEYSSQGEPTEQLERDRATLRRLWQEWLKKHGVEEQASYFPLFRYEVMREYIRQMVTAIRAAGAKQPVAVSSFGIVGDDIRQAIADSECEAITFSAYPGGWGRVNDGINLLSSAGNMSVPAELSGKGRLVYEFDTPATNVSCYLFPALARMWRSGEVQVACQFQYDSISTARYNTDWNAHWLNWLYTPSKTVSFMIGGEVFRRLPRRATFETPPDNQVFGPAAVSFAHNQSLLATDDLFMHARTVGGWQPLKLPSTPRRIVGVGSSSFVEYGGTGLYELEVVGDRGELRINPDVRLVGNCLQGGLNAPVAELEPGSRHLFRLRLPGWEQAKCFRKAEAGSEPVSIVDGGWVLGSGEYELRR